MFGASSELASVMKFGIMFFAADKSVTVQTKRHMNSKLSVPTMSPYGGIKNRGDLDFVMTSGRFLLVTVCFLLAH